MDYEETARRFIAAVEGGDSVGVEAMLADDVEQTELPNRLMPTGATRDKAAVLAAGERGRKVMSAQRYEILTVTAAFERVVLELAWTGTLAVQSGRSRGRRDEGTIRVRHRVPRGKVWRMRNYDCFDPW